jgi:hypothetical protein
VAKKSPDRPAKALAARSVSVAPRAQLFRFGPFIDRFFWTALMDTIETRGAAEAPGGRIGSGGEAEHGLTPGGDPERHPTIDNVNALLAERLSPTEHICRRIAAMTGAPAREGDRAGDSQARGRSSSGSSTRQRKQ